MNTKKNTNTHTQIYIICMKPQILSTKKKNCNLKNNKITVMKQLKINLILFTCATLDNESDHNTLIISIKNIV